MTQIQSFPVVSFPTPAVSVVPEGIFFTDIGGFRALMHEHLPSDSTITEPAADTGLLVSLAVPVPSSIPFAMPAPEHSPADFPIPASTAQAEPTADSSNLPETSPRFGAPANVAPPQLGTDGVDLAEETISEPGSLVAGVMAMIVGAQSNRPLPGESGADAAESATDAPQKPAAAGLGMALSLAPAEARPRPIAAGTTTQNGRSIAPEAGLSLAQLAPAAGSADAGTTALAPSPTGPGQSLAPTPPPNGANPVPRPNAAPVTLTKATTVAEDEPPPSPSGPQAFAPHQWPSDQVASAARTSEHEAPTTAQPAKPTAIRMVSGQNLLDFADSGAGTPDIPPPLWSAFGLSQPDQPATPRPEMALGERAARSLWHEPMAEITQPTAAALVWPQTGTATASVPKETAPENATTAVFPDAAPASPKDQFLQVSGIEGSGQIPVADRPTPPTATVPLPIPGPPLGLLPSAGPPPTAIALPIDVLRSDSPLPAAMPSVPVQITQALSSGGPVIELRLSPEELGQVRIDVRHDGERLVMTVSAERQDTLDLLRRHAGELAADLRASGHAGLDLSFGRWNSPGSDTGRDQQPSPQMPVLTHAESTAIQPGALQAAAQPFLPGSGLYLRI